MKTVCILFGGVSSEHEVSLLSSSSVLRNIDRTRYDVVMLGITKDGRWLRYQGDIDHIRDGSWETAGKTTPAVLSPDRSHRGILELGEDGPRAMPVDVVFPVLHGKNGEDGTVQGLLDLAGIPYVGCGVLSSAVCMDKDISHTLLLHAGVPKTRLITLTASDLNDMASLEPRLREELGYPMFVKPANAGSSVGVSKVSASDKLLPALELALRHDAKIVVEQAVVGKEVECAVLGNEAPIPSDVIAEIAPKNEFYDYEGKYLDDSTDLYVPARVSDEVAQKVRETAVTAYKALGCRGLARVDFFAREDGSIILNEINTLPGFTSISMYPRLFEASGVPYSQLITRLIEYAAD